MVSPQKEEVVDIVVKMELDPVKKANAPAVAIRMYERPTTLKLRRVSHLYFRNFTASQPVADFVTLSLVGVLGRNNVSSFGSHGRQASKGSRRYRLDLRRETSLLSRYSTATWYPWRILCGNESVILLSSPVSLSSLTFANDIYQRATKSLTGTDSKPNDSDGSKTLTSTTLIAHRPLNLSSKRKPMPKSLPLSNPKLSPNLNPTALPNYTLALHPLSSNLRIPPTSITAPQQWRTIRSSLWSGVRMAKRRG